MTTILHCKKILITAGPTREAIDPVRYISNHSSGKMGFAIAEQFLVQGGGSLPRIGTGMHRIITPPVERSKSEHCK